MDITNMLVMDWTFWEAVHTGLQRWGKTMARNRTDVKCFRFHERQGHPCIRRICQRGFWGERRWTQDPRSQIKQKYQPARVFSKYFQMGGPLLLFAQYFWASYLSSGSILASMFLSVAYQSHSVWKQYHRFRLVQCVWQRAGCGKVLRSQRA